MKVFFDSSSFAKRYVDEIGSDKVDELCQKADEVGISILAITEFISAARRLYREKNISKKQYEILKETMLAESEDMMICDLIPDVVFGSVNVIERNTIKSSDAIHVASAIEWQADIFVTSDKQQKTAAKKMGLNVNYI